MLELHPDRADGEAHGVAVLAAEVVVGIAFGPQRQAHAATVDAVLVRSAALRRATGESADWTRFATYFVDAGKQ